MLDVSVREKDGIVVLDVRGRLVFGHDGPTLVERVKQLVAAKQLSVLINLAEVTFIDSSGVGELVASLSSVKKAGGTLKAFGAPPLVRDVLRIVRVTTIIDVYDTEPEALASFA